MDNPELDRLCKLIYTNHRQALELIWDRVGSPASGLVGAIKDWLVARPNEWIVIAAKDKEVEFIPRHWDDMLPPIGRRKTFEKVHWLNLYLRVFPDCIHFCVKASPTTDADFRRRLILKLLDGGPGCKLNGKRKDRITDGWTRVHSEEICKFEEGEEPEHDEAIQKIGARLTAFLADNAQLPVVIAELVTKHPPQSVAPSAQTAVPIAARAT